MMTNHEPSNFVRNISDKKFVRAGYLLLVGLILSFGLWSVFAQINGAIISQGNLQVETGRHIVQHKYGGNVSAILVKENDQVQKGQTLIQLEDTELRSQYGVASQAYYQSLAQSERLKQEAQSSENLEFSEELQDAATKRSDIEELVRAEALLFEARVNNFNNQIQRHNERDAQLSGLIENSQTQVEELEGQERFNQEELDRQEDLFEKKLSRSQELNSARNTLSQTRNSLNAARSTLLDYQSEFDQNKTALETLKTEHLEAIYTQLGDAEQRLAKAREELALLEDQLERLSIVAPNDGNVYGLALNSTEAVISPAEPIMYVVPSDAPLIVSSRVSAQDIDDVFLKQNAEIVFSGLQSDMLPRLHGVVSNITADAIVDERTGQQFFEVETTIPMDELLSIENVAFRPGMPAEVFLITTARTPLEYFTEPMTRYLGRAMR